MPAPHLRRFAVRALGSVLLASVVFAQTACTPPSQRTQAPQPAEAAATVKAEPSAPPERTTRKPVTTSAPRVGARSVIVMNFDTGVVLYAKHPKARYPIASLTKIMTARIVMAATRPAEMVTASKRAAKQIPTKLGLRPGDQLNVHDLLYALMLHSSNDVAVALAEHVAGSVRAFDALMTAQGVDIGLTDTSFASPSGLNDKGYSTARDVATMTRWAYESNRFASIVATRRYTVTMPGGEHVRFHNLNALLFDYPGALGVKTGYTSDAHWSLVGIAQRGSIRIMVVLLADPKIPFKDGTALLDWGFARESGLMSRTG
jgi:serine-type D-Ala-D-Ala carboxypeptidase (penicillin-binding protein 5/6)